MADDLNPEWEEHVRTELVPMVTSSAFVMSLVPEGDFDVKFAVELGVAIMLDKPIVLMVREGVAVPPGLARIAHAQIAVPTDTGEWSSVLADAVANLDLSRGEDDD